MNKLSAAVARVWARKRGHVLLPWRRICISLAGVAVVLGAWRLAVMQLYVLPEYSMDAFSEITKCALYTVGGIVVFLVTGHMAYEWVVGNQPNEAEDGKL